MANYTFTDWLVAYSHFAYPDKHQEPATCPNCGAREFGLVFGAAPGQPRGRAEFWCKNCLVGTLRYGVPVIDGAVVIPLDASTEVHDSLIPQFTKVPGLE
jgi:hypothetical protein